jgi:hypothetical protein
MSLAMLFDSEFVEQSTSKREIILMATKEEKLNFSLQIETLAATLGISYIEAITHHCEATGLEVEMAATLINDSLKSKIECEAQHLRYLPRASRLPI